MLKLFCYFITLTFLSSAAFAAQLESANYIDSSVATPNGPNVGNVVHTPKTITFDENLVVFYQQKNNNNQAAFSIGTRDTQYAYPPILKWQEATKDSATFKIDTTFIQGDKFSPTPALLKNRLYVFGSNKNNELIYNSVDSLAQLQNGEWNSATPMHHKNDNHAYTQLANAEISALGYVDPQDKINKILIVYYAKESDSVFSYSVCQAVEHSVGLACTGGWVSQMHDGAPSLTLFNGLPYLYIRNTTSADLAVYYYYSKAWFRDTILDVNTSVHPVGVITSDVSANFLYTVYGSKILRTETERNVEQDTETNPAAKGVSSVTYMGCGFIFYASDNKNLRYYNDLNSNNCSTVF